jgi:hypothetical protein
VSSVEQVLSEQRSTAAVLRRCGQRELAATLERVCDQFEEAAAPFLLWVTEAEALAVTGRSLRWLRTRYARWVDEGHAIRRGSTRLYRSIILPRKRFSRPRIAHQLAPGSFNAKKVLKP